MRKILVIIAVVVGIGVYMSMNQSGFDFSLSLPSVTAANVHAEADSENVDELLIDTIMSCGSHAFGYSGDITMWGGWYFDTIHVGDDRMLICDSVGPSTLRLNLVTRQLIVDFNNPDAADKIKAFMKPIEGLKRFKQKYEVCLDSAEDKEYGMLKCNGSVSIIADYADSGNENADKLYRFICKLADASETKGVNTTASTTADAIYNPTKHYTRVADEMSDLSDFIANKRFENWRCDDDLLFHGSMAYDLEIRAGIISPKFVTLSKYEYERRGANHGMYTITFHTFDLKSETLLSNDDIFKNNTLDKVTSQLLEVMAKDSRYAAWNGRAESGSEREDLDMDFVLPEGALTASGVVFSFQPYEISSWAAGAFHFIVPYEQLMPYLTPRVKAMIRE